VDGLLGPIRIIGATSFDTDYTRPNLSIWSVTHTETWEISHTASSAIRACISYTSTVNSFFIRCT